MSNLQNLHVKYRLWTSSLELDTCLILFSKILLPFRLFRFLFVLNIFETLLSFPVAAATIFCLFFFVHVCISVVHKVFVGPSLTHRTVARFASWSHDRYVASGKLLVSQILFGPGCV